MEPRATGVHGSSPIDAGVVMASRVLSLMIPADLVRRGGRPDSHYRHKAVNVCLVENLTNPPLVKKPRETYWCGDRLSCIERV